MREATDRLEAGHLRVLFPRAGFSWALDRVGEGCNGLLPAERELLPRAVPQRLAAFAAGRRCARAALQDLRLRQGWRLDYAGLALLRDAHGSPCWPPEVAGSISHSPRLALAVVAPRVQIQAIGVDLESLDHDIGAATLARVFDAQEQAWLERCPPEQRDTWAYLLFSARESLYKCVYQACGRRLGAHEVRLRVDTATHSFQVQWLGPASCLGLPALQGRYLLQAGHVCTSVWLNAPPVPHPSLNLEEVLHHV